MNTYENLKKEIKSLEALRELLEFTEKFPEMGVKVEIILADMQRTSKRIHDLVNPDEGGMLVSEKVETPQKGDICTFWNNDAFFAIVRPYEKCEKGWHVDSWAGEEWENCKVIKKGECNV